VTGRRRSHNAIKSYAERIILRAIDPGWLRDEYETKHRTIKEIAASLASPASDLAHHARTLGITLRHGVTSRKYVLAGPRRPHRVHHHRLDGFRQPQSRTPHPPSFGHPGHANLNHAAKHVGARKATLARQVHQLEQAVGARLLTPASGPLGITFTPAGEQFERQIRAILDLLDQAQSPGIESR
jgi:hypothetical protein